MNCKRRCEKSLTSKLGIDAEVDNESEPPHVGSYSSWVAPFDRTFMHWDLEPRRIGITRSATVPERPVAARAHHAAGWKENQSGSDALRLVLRTQPRSGSVRRLADISRG